MLDASRIPISDLHYTGKPQFFNLSSMLSLKVSTTVCFGTEEERRHRGRKRKRHTSASVE